jgi:anti-anti-sigma factor
MSFSTPATAKQYAAEILACAGTGAGSKEPKLKLSLETRHSGNVIIIHCEGRIVYRDEAAALYRVVGEALQDTREVILDFEGVKSIDSAGLGELVLAHVGGGAGQECEIVGRQASRAGGVGADEFEFRDCHVSQPGGCDRDWG